jgi:hypothetical protein
MATLVNAVAGADNNAITGMRPALPSGWQPGDLAIVAGHINNASSFGSPLGWSKVREALRNSGVLDSCVLYFRVLQAGDVAPVITSTPAAGWQAWVCAVFRAGPGERFSTNLSSAWAPVFTLGPANGATPPADGTGLSQVVNAAEVPTAALSFVVHLARSQQSAVATTCSTPAGYTLAAQASTSGMTVNQLSAHGFYRLAAGPGTVAPAAATVTNNGLGVYDFGLHVTFPLLIKTGTGRPLTAADAITAPAAGVKGGRGTAAVSHAFEVPAALGEKRGRGKAATALGAALVIETAGVQRPTRNLNFSLGRVRASVQVSVPYVDDHRGAAVPIFIPAITSEYLHVDVIGGPVDKPTAHVALVPYAATPTPDDWQPAGWVEDAESTVRFLAGGYAPGTYAVWVRFDDSPEVPVRRAGQVTFV